jgi:ATP-dependent Lon protease
MSTKSNTASAVRAIMLDPTKLTGPRQPRSPLGLPQRMAGGEMEGWSVVEDLRSVVTPLIRLPLSPRCRRALERAYDTVSVRDISRLERVLDTELLRTDLPHMAAPVIQAAAGVLVFHLAELGCRLAAARLAAQLISEAHGAVCTGRLDKAFLLFRHALFRSEEAELGRGRSELATGPLYSVLETYDVAAELWMQATTTFVTAKGMVETEDDILRGGVGMSVPPLPLVDLGELDDILGAAAEAKVAKALTLDVFPTMEHLPQPSKSVQDRGDSPRAIAEPWAGKGMPLTSAPDVIAFVEGLRARFPWAGTVIDAYAADLVGAPYAAVRPRILLGPPGCGKTAFARAVLEAAGLDVTVYGASGAIDGGAWAGTSRQWGSWRPSVPAQGNLRFGKASHGIVLDEVEKAGNDRRWGRLDEVLLPFLERSTARAIHDPAFECAVNLSAVSYVLTANSIAGLARPLLDRCQVLPWPAPRAEDLPIVAAGILAEIRRERGMDAAWCPDLDGEELSLIPWTGGSMRPLRRMVEAVVASREIEARRRPN